MTNLAGEYKGKMMTWKEIVEIFPSKWVYVTDYEMDGPDIIKGKIVGVVTDKDNGSMYIAEITELTMCVAEQLMILGILHLMAKG